MSESNEKIDKIREKITANDRMSLSRVPPKTKKRFMEIASYEDFCSDRGMALKYLVDFHDGIIPSGIEHLELEIERLRQELDALKETKEEPTKRTNRLRG